MEDDYAEEHLVLLPMPPELAVRIKQGAIAQECTMNELIGKALDTLEELNKLGPVTMELVRSANKALRTPQLEPQAPSKSPMYRTSRGAELPIGLKMTADYRGNRFIAKVVPRGIQLENGQIYPDPSAAAVACKLDTGVSRDSAQTNGWNFWTFKVTNNKIASINLFRSNPERAVDEWKLQSARDAAGVVMIRGDE